MNEVKNISSQLLIEELQRRLNEEGKYQKQIDDLNQTISVISKKLSESEALKSHFISNISNELINPFTSVLAIAENILGVKKENWKKVIQMVSLIHTEVFNLDFQLKNIFLAAKLEAGEIGPEITKINIDQLFSDLVKPFQYEARRKHLHIEYSASDEENKSPIFFKSDAPKIQLILSNLLSNAIKFSYEEGKILLLVHKKNASLTITVQDFGQGISKANEQIIFDRFKRVDNGINSINRGHGLGLSIIKALIDALNGKISFESELGKGASFEINLSESNEETTGISTSADETYFKDELF